MAGFVARLAGVKEIAGRQPLPGIVVNATHVVTQWMSDMNCVCGLRRERCKIPEKSAFSTAP